MKLALQLDQVNLSVFEDMWRELLKFTPKLIAVIAVLIIGWLLIKIVSFFIKKALKFSKIDVLTEKMKSLGLLPMPFQFEFEGAKIMASIDHN